jgi:dTDP-glucose 4,6-dehydratase
MKKLLITGGAGFIGANFAHYWHKHHPRDEITVLDALTYAGNRHSIEDLISQSRIAFFHGDICDEQLVTEIINERKINTIVHFAAESHVDRSIHGPDAFVQSNIVGTHTLLKCARRYWQGNETFQDKHHFHHVSTDEVYGSLADADAAFTESTPYDPSSPYSASKAASDHLVRAYQRTYGINTTISNCSNNYGPYHFPEKLIPLTILNILHGKEIPVYGNGSNIRDWLYVEDHCRGIELILHKGKYGETYNIGGMCELSNIDLVRMICQIVDGLFAETPEHLLTYPDAPANRHQPSGSLITFVKDRPGHDQRYAMNIDKISAELEFKPVETFASGLKKTIQWYLDNPQWWQPVLDQTYKGWIKQQYEQN